MEKLIIEQLKQGNEDAFKYIYKQHYVLLCRFANQMLADAALAEEIVDDAIFYLWEHRSDIEIEYSIRAYLMRAVRNRCLNELNSLRRREELLVSSFFLPENMEFLDRVFVDPCLHSTFPAIYLLEQELESELIRNIEELPLECRTVFKKNRFEQKKYEEIAIELNISVNTVKYHMKKALSCLQQRMEKYLKLLVLYVFLGN